ncbi:MAG: serine hydrolase [Lachnospiraceae bacterium]|nr:serine hydrolase [Lachnospiraceae bacterium]
MGKYVCRFIAVLLSFVLFTGGYPVYAETKETEETAEKKEPGSLYSKACALVDGESGRVLYGREEQTPLPNASTTKILTCILALENGQPEELVTFSAKAAAQPKVHLGAKEGEKFALLDLLYGLMLESYNDCAYAIAEQVGGSVEAFADMMNEKAKEIGCTDSHFVTPNGLDAKDEEGEHHTTAADLCRIMAYCTWDSPKSADFLAITRAKNHSFQNVNGTEYSVYNKNVFLDMMDCALSGKTGYTAKAGYCYVAAAEEGGRRFCIALLGCGWPNHKNYKWEDAKKLFQFGLDNYHLYQGTESAFELSPVQIGCGYRRGTLSEWGTRTKLALSVACDQKKMTFLKADWDQAEIRKEMTELVTLPVQKGKKLGKISYCINGETIYSFDICAGEDVYAWDFDTFLKAVWKEFLLGPIR